MRPPTTVYLELQPLYYVYNRDRITPKAFVLSATNYYQPAALVQHAQPILIPSSEYTS